MLSDRLLAIPDYQRTYSWKADEIEDLWRDISDAMDAGAPEYFLGSVVTTRSEEQERYQVIDGQQRLATVSLTYAAIRDILKSRADERADEVERKTLGERDIVTRNLQPRLVLNAEDNDLFRQLTLLPPDERQLAAQQDSHRRIINAYDFFHAQLLERVDGLGPDERSSTTRLTTSTTRTTSGPPRRTTPPTTSSPTPLQSPHPLRLASTSPTPLSRRSRADWLASPPSGWCSYWGRSPRAGRGAANLDGRRIGHRGLRPHSRLPRVLPHGRRAPCPRAGPDAEAHVLTSPVGTPRALAALPDRGSASPYRARPVARSPTWTSCPRSATAVDDSAGMLVGIRRYP
jgi:Protein of unknown function DUF262